MDLITFLIILLLHNFNLPPGRAEECETRISNGGLRGVKMVSRSGRLFCAFLGIPYAAPPIGKLRFQPPEPPRPWEGIGNFTQESVQCLQVKATEDGSEDCLYLNAFTHKALQNQSNPVMVYIHGGGFRVGSSSTNDHGPGYLMDKDIVLVTLQYRLGPFGFLSTEDNVIPGNMGLKDQVKALQWVRENIKHFGGDPEKVTLFGNSAGGASVHLHMMSPVSRDLFARGISQSGTALSGFAVAGKGVTRSVTLNIASKLNCSSSDSSDILVCMQNKTSHDIISTHFDIIQTKCNEINLRPVVEVESEHAFLTSPAHKSLTDKPWLAGVVKNEGIVFLPIQRLNFILHLVNSNFDAAISEFFYLEERYTNLSEVIRKIRETYFKSHPSESDQIKSLKELLTDLWFIWPTENAFANNNQTSYYYLYDHLGEHSNVELYNSLKGYGVAHTDELLAIFSNKFYPPLNQQDTNISKLLVDLWVNFATTGNPTPHPISNNPQEKGEDNFTWEKTNIIDHKYLHIQTNSLEMKTGLFSNRSELWKELESNVRSEE